MAQAHADEDPLVGKVLNERFRVLAPIGAGGMGRVYKAIQEPIDRVVALKVLNPRYDGQKDPEFERRFFFEASMTAKLKHPNTITVHDFGCTPDGIYYLAMEFLEGETLLQVLRRGPLSWPRTLAIGGQIARSLREAHKHGMVHRDLKPANVMVLAEGTGGDVVKVLDFGLVKSFLGEKKKTVTSAEEEEGELTKAGVLLGSPLYMAPEQARGEADGRTDIYALGVVMFQCIAGRPPFVGKESIDILVKQVREKPPVLKELVPDIPDEVNALVMRCLAKSPAARFQTMDDVLEAMRQVMTGQGLSSVFADPRYAMSPAEEPTRSPSGREASERPTGASAEIDVTDSRVQPTVVTRVPWGLLLAAAGVLVGVLGGVVYFVVGEPDLRWVPADRIEPEGAQPVAPNPPVVPSEATPPSPPPPLATPKPVDIVFELQTEPPGANVLQDGEPVGTTPLSITLTRAAAAEAARAELTFELDGYQPATVVVQGRDGVVPVHQVLQKKAGVTPPGKTGSSPKKPPRPNSPSGYKEDPYQ